MINRNYNTPRHFRHKRRARNEEVADIKFMVEDLLKYRNFHRRKRGHTAECHVSSSLWS